MPARAIAAVVAAATWFAFPSETHAGGEWPDGPYTGWFQNLKRPDNAQHPYRELDPKSLYCCGVADVVKTKFKVERAGGRYPEDQWYAWLNDTWTPNPSEKVHEEYAPNGEAYLFMLAGTIQCFVRPRGGL